MGARAAWFLIALAVLAGCAGDPRPTKGLQWVLEQEAERQRLESEGFPQYTGDN